MTDEARETAGPVEAAGTPSGGSPVRRLHPRRGPGWAGVRFAVALPVVAACGAWVFGSRGWLVDLLAQVAAQAGLVAFVLGVWWLVRRRWLAGGFAVVGVAFAVVGVVSPGRVWVTSDAVDESAVVRVMVFNALASNGDEAGVRSAIVDADADVLALLEAPAWLVEELKVGGEWRGRYPYYWVAAKAGAGFKVVMTKWPQVDPVSGQTGAWYAAVDGLRQVIVDRPDDRGGRFAFTLVHPASPRTRERWEAGNDRLTTFIERVRAHIEPRGLPHLAGGDWNATPTGSRSRRVWSELGLRRAKPVLGLTGTWPASSVWPAQLAIDDVVVPAGARVVSWEAVGGTGSDHLAVVVGVEVR